MFSTWLKLPNRVDLLNNFYLQTGGIEKISVEEQRPPILFKIKIGAHG